MRRNGGIIGKSNIPADNVASGVWGLREATSYRRNGVWPEIISYSVTESSSSVNEDSSLVFNVSTTGVPDGETLYWTVSNPSEFSTSSGSFTVTGQAGSFSVTPTADLTATSTRSFTASVRTGSTSGPIVATSGTVDINDVTLSISGPTSIIENQKATFTVTGPAADGTLLYYTVTGGGDFNGSYIPRTGSFTMNSGSGTFTVSPPGDFTTDSGETFQAQVRVDSTSGTVILTSPSCTVADSEFSVGGGTATTVSLPPNVQAGDLLIAFNTKDADFAAAPTGFTVLNITNSGTSYGGVLSYKILQASDITAGTVTATEANSYHALIAYRLSGLTSVTSGTFTGATSNSNISAQTISNSEVSGSTVQIAIMAYRCGSGLTGFSFSGNDIHTANDYVGADSGNRGLALKVGFGTSVDVDIGDGGAYNLLISGAIGLNT